MLDARYDDFQETTDAGLVSRNGNRPANIPNVIVDLQSSYRIGQRRPVDIGGTYR